MEKQCKARLLYGLANAVLENSPVLANYWLRDTYGLVVAGEVERLEEIAETRRFQLVILGCV